MKIPRIDKTPPEDYKAMPNYVFYLVERLNYIITLIEKELENGDI